MTTEVPQTLDQQVASAASGKYGAGKFPFGGCDWPGCPKPACHRHETSLVCRDHLPEEVIFAPLLGQQEKFLASNARWVLFGGGAGGSKTFAASRAWLKQWQKAQEFWELTGITSKGHCIFFRRTMPELLQVIDDFRRYYKKIDEGANWNERDHLCTFPCGYKVQFAGMEGEHDWQKYYGPAYTMCVARGTPVRMGDGSTAPIQSLKPGDEVMTLEGPRKVVALSSPRTTQCVRADVMCPDGQVRSQVHPTTHPILTSGLSPPEASSSGSQQRLQSPSESYRTWLDYETLLAERRGSPAADASREDAGSDCAASGGLPREDRPPLWLTVPVALAGPDPRLGRPDSDDLRSAPIPRDAIAHAHAPTTGRSGFLADCPSDRDSDGGRSRGPAGGDQESTLQLGRAGERIQSGLLLDAHERSPARTHQRRASYAHPYTSEERPVSAVDIVDAPCLLTPVGECEVFDVQIEDVNHYITDCGLVNKNCVFDEAVGFTQKQIEELDSRLRTDDPVLGPMLQLILCTNPIGSVTKLWLRRRFVEAADPETPVLVRVPLADGRVIEEWQVYIPANLYDNPYLMEDGRYEANLMTKGSATKRALLLNDWYVDEGAWVGDDWDPAIHVCDPFPIPRAWFKFKFADYGFSARSSVMWAACDPEGNMIVYRSYSCRGKTAEELGRQVREIEIQAGEWDREADCSNVYGPMDSSLWARVGETGPSRGEILDNMGCAFTRSDKNPDSAAEQIRSRLRRRTPDAHGNMVVPGLRFFRTCKSRLRAKDGGWEETGPIATIPLVQCDPNNPDRWDTNDDDHDLDALGYGCLSRPLPGEHELPQSQAEATVIELLRFREEPKRAAVFPER